MTGFEESPPVWGEPPWRIDFRSEPSSLPAKVDIAVVGGGFTGLAAAACLRRLDPGRTVVLLEARGLGSGASGRTGGLALEGTAYGDLTGLGDVLQGFTRILEELNVDCQLTLPGVWEIAHVDGRINSPIAWQDSGTLRVVRDVPGGTVDPGRLVSGLARAAQRLGVILREDVRVRDVRFGDPLKLVLPERELTARQVLFATNAQSLELSGLTRRAQATLTLAVATESLTEDQRCTIGLGQRKGFYTIDLPYLWGRLLPNDGVIFGGGVIYASDDQELASISVRRGQAARMLAHLKQRVRALHPALASIKFTHGWGGPILFPRSECPLFARHPRGANTLVVGGYAGHGVVLSVYLASWAAEVLLGRRTLPGWA